jgi:hypothetical protein
MQVCARARPISSVRMLRFGQQLPNAPSEAQRLIAQADVSMLPIAPSEAQ